jgi:hypothetical protein
MVRTKVLPQAAAAAREKEAYDAKREVITYVPGEYVLVRRAEPENQLATVWRGPYRVRAQVGDNVYEVEDALLENVVKVHVSRMRLFSMERTTVAAEAVRMVPEGQYIVREVVGHRWDGDELAVQVWWKGYPKE